jgi:hypothetical protein
MSESLVVRLRGLCVARVFIGIAVIGLLASFTVPRAVYAGTPAKKVCHTVTKKVHGKKTKVKVCKNVPKPTATAKPKPTATPYPTATPVPPTVTSVNFYSSVSHVNCVPASSSTSLFTTSESEIDVVVDVSGWSEPHTGAVEFYAPDGSRYATFGPSSMSAIGVYCYFLPVSGTRAAQEAGTWTVRVYTDGVQAYTASFTLLAPQPTAVPTSPPAARIQLVTPPAPSPTFSYQPYHTGSFDGVVYTAGNLYAIAGLDCSGTQCGYEAGSSNSYGNPAPSGFMYVWVFATEGAQQYASSFYSSFLDFQLRGADGQIYNVIPSAPPYTHGQAVMDGAQLVAGDKNAGWMEFQVPASGGRYDLRWTGTPFIEVVTSFTVTP